MLKYIVQVLVSTRASLFNEGYGIYIISVQRNHYTLELI